jgi:hypothetical protein
LQWLVLEFWGGLAEKAWTEEPVLWFVVRFV